MPVEDLKGETLPIDQLLILIPLIVITVTTIIGNLFVCLAVIVQKSLRTPPNAYLVSLALIDLSVGVFILPLNISQFVNKSWNYGSLVCGIWITSDVALCTLSIYHLIAIGVDRFRAITEGIHYLQQRSFKSVLLTVVFLWVVALWTSTPPLLGWNENDWGETGQASITICQLTSNRGYVVHSAFGTLMFPMFLMVLIYGKIYYAIKAKLMARAKVPGFEASIADRISGTGETDSSEDVLEDSKNRRRNKSSWIGLKMSKLKSKSVGEINMDASPTEMHMESSSKSKTLESMRTRPTSQIQEFLQKKLKFSLTRERRAARTLGIIIVSFVICWLPFTCLYVINAFVPHEYKADPVWFDIFTWLGYTNSAINPFIYNAYNTEFRKAFRKILCFLTRK